MTNSRLMAVVVRHGPSHSTPLWWRACFIGVLASFTTWLIPPAARAVSRTEAMLAQVPADAAIVITWEGLNDNHPGYADSTLRQLLIDTHWPQRVERIIGPLLEKLKEQEPQDADQIEAFKRVLPAAWHQPWVLWLGGPDVVNELEAEPGFGWVMLADQYSDHLRQTIHHVIEIEDSTDLTIIDSEGLLGIRTSSAAESSQRQAPKIGLMPSHIKHPVLRVEVDIARFCEDFFEMPSFMNDGDSRVFLAVLDDLGLLGIQRLSLAGGFTDKDWVSTIDVLAPAPRKGLIAALIDGPAIADDLMGMTGPHTVYARTMRLDAAAMWDAIESPIRIGFQPERGDDANVDDGLAMLNEHAGFDVRGELIAGLGDTWLVYQDKLFPSAMMMPGVCVVHPLRDADKTRAALDQLTAWGNSELEKNEVGFRFEQREESGIVMSVLSAPLFNPAWAVVDGTLVIGLSPQSVATAAEYLAPGAGSVMDSPRFVDSMNLLDTPASLHGRVFVDLQQTIIPQYNNLTTVLNFFSMGAQQELDVDLRQLLPPLSTIMKHARPVAGAAWVDEQGYHSRARGPFPMANLLSPDASFGASNVSTVALLVGILLPALGAARRTARQMQDATQARAIHQGMMNHAQSNHDLVGGKPLTDDIADLYEADVIAGSIEYFVSGSSTTSVPDDFEDWDLEDRKDWIRLNSDFIVVPGLIDDTDPQKIAVFLRPDIYGDGPDDRRGTVTYNDGSTTFQTDWDSVEQQLIAQTGMTAEQLIERQQQLAGNE